MTKGVVSNQLLLGSNKLQKTATNLADTNLLTVG